MRWIYVGSTSQIILILVLLAVSVWRDGIAVTTNTGDEFVEGMCDGVLDIATPPPNPNPQEY